MKTLVFRRGVKMDGKVLLAKMLCEEAGIFESMRAYNGIIFRLEEHLSRLRESAKTAGFSAPLSAGQLRMELQMALQAFGKKEAFVRLTLVDGESFVMMGERRHSAMIYRRGVSLRTSAVKRSLSNSAFPEAKTTAYQNAVAATLEPASEETYEWIFLDRNGYATEVRIGNLFIVAQTRKRKKRVPLILTPPPAGILNGVTRRFVIECAACGGFEARETPLTRHDIYNAREAFLTNTSWEILPVRELDKRPIGDEIPGPVTLKLQSLFKEKVYQECQIR